MCGLDAVNGFKLKAALGITLLALCFKAVLGFTLWALRFKT